MFVRNLCVDAADERDRQFLSRVIRGLVKRVREELRRFDAKLPGKRRFDVVVSVLERKSYLRDAKDLAHLFDVVRSYFRSVPLDCDGEEDRIRKNIRPENLSIGLGKFRFKKSFGSKPSQFSFRPAIRNAGSRLAHFEYEKHVIGPCARRIDSTLGRYSPEREVRSLRLDQDFLANLACRGFMERFTQRDLVLAADGRPEANIGILFTLHQEKAPRVIAD